MSGTFDLGGLGSNGLAVCVGFCFGFLGFGIVVVGLLCDAGLGC